MAGSLLKFSAKTLPRVAQRFTPRATVEDLLQARAHLGHKEGLLDPHMRPYIFGKRLGVLIFDLEQTVKLMNRALDVTEEIAYRNGIIMFTTASRQNGYLVEDAAKECGEYAYCRRWRMQVFTNPHRLFSAVTRLPDLMIFFSTQDLTESLHKAITASAKMLIPSVAICDTNSDPTLVTYPVPGNDDTPQSIEYYSRMFKDAVLAGKARRKQVIDEFGEEFYNKSLDGSPVD